MNDAPRFVFAGGGTGGHLFPCLAVASEIQSAIPDARFAFFVTQRDFDRQVLASTEHAVIPQPVRPLRVRTPWSWPGFLTAWYRSRKACRAFLQQHWPAVVIGSGGFASAPVVGEAHRLGIPTAVLNPDAVPGRANRYLAARADVIFVQWEESVERFNGHAAVRVTGCPVRREFRTAQREAGLRRFGLEPARRTLLITGASQGARSINEAVLAVLDALAAIPGWQILHISGEADRHRVAQTYESRAVVGKVVAFTEHMGDALAAADLVVSRAGASTLAEITALARPSVLMPYPHHSDRHQEANARVLVKRGAARMVRDRVDARLNGPALLSVLDYLMKDADELSRLADAARRLGRACAADEVAAWVVALSRDARPPKKSRDEENSDASPI